MGCWPHSRWDVSPRATGQEEADEADLLRASGAAQTKHTPHWPPHCSELTALQEKGEEKVFSVKK